MADKTVYRSATENPFHICMPLGGIMPFKGIEGCMILVHGAQGCSTYMRRLLTEHYSESLEIGSTCLNEKGTIYGGEKNLKQGLENIRKVYNPKVIGVLTTCLSETIGDDVERFAEEYLADNDCGDLKIVTVPTPGYGGTQAEGFYVTARRILAKLTQPAPKHEKINLIVSHITPADIREIKRILDLMEVAYTLFPDYEETLDGMYRDEYYKIVPGGTALAEIEKMSGAAATIEMGLTVDPEHSPGQLLLDQYEVPLHRVPIPVGIENCDQFFRVVAKVTGKKIPEQIDKERRRLLDAMIDSHKYNAEGRSAIYGEPEMVYATTKLCLENGIQPVVVACGRGGNKLTALLAAEMEDCLEDVLVLSESDLADIRGISAMKNANVAIGHSKGHYLTEKAGLPLVRMGLPIIDRVGGQRLLSVGYDGTIQFLDRITNTLLENKQRTYRTQMYEKYYKGQRKNITLVKNSAN